jgi:hypothetical protein
MAAGRGAKTVNRIVRDQCCGALIDVQPFFLSQLDKRQRSRLTTNIKNFVRLLGYFQIPLIVTIERPIEQKGRLPKGNRRTIGPARRNP